MRLKSRYCIPFFLLLLGCDDPTSVGADRLTDQSLNVREQSVSMDVGSMPFSDISGDQPTVLVGGVEDPIGGSTRAVAYVSFADIVTTDAFASGPVTQATMIVRPTYRFGYTSNPLSVKIGAIEEVWSASGRKTDSTLAVISGDLGSADWASTDSLARITLDPAWLNSWQDDLKSGSGSNIPGLVLSSDANWVMGFNADAQLEVISGGDTLRFPVEQTFTEISHTGSSLGTLVDGSGETSTLEIAWSTAEDWQAVTLSGAKIVVDIDTSLIASQTPPGFERGALPSLRLIGIDTEDNRFEIETTGFSSSESAYVFSSSYLRAILQDASKGQSSLARFMVDVPVSLNTVARIPLVGGSGNTPRVKLVVVSPENGQ